MPANELVPIGESLKGYAPGAPTPRRKRGPNKYAWPDADELEQFRRLRKPIQIARFLYPFRDPELRSRLAEQHPAQRAAHQALAAIEQLEQDEGEDVRAGEAPRPLTRTPPQGEAQLDMLVPFPHDVASKDAVRLMECAPFRLSKRPSPNQSQLTYSFENSAIEIIPNPDLGLPTAKDYDFVQFICSHLQEAVNRGEIPGRVFLVRGHEFLRFARREQGGKQHAQIEPMIDRLQGTIVKRYALGADGKRGPPEWLSLVSYCKILSYTPSGKVDQIRVDIPLWLYEAIVGRSVRGDTPHVLTLSRDYYLLTSPIDRFLYRFARHRAGKTDAVLPLEDLHRRSGSTRDLRHFRSYLRHLPRGRILEYGFTIKRSRRQENVHISNLATEGDKDGEGVDAHARAA